MTNEISGSVLFIDPGLRGCGVGLFRNRRVYAAGYVVNTESAGRGLRVCSQMARLVVGWLGLVPTKPADIDLLVCEFPRIYPGYKRAEDPNDLLDLACVIGGISTYFEFKRIQHVFPSDWKGNVPKKVMTERIKHAIDSDERARIVSAGYKDHNTFDAVGMGLNYYGRLTKKVYA